jgi:hypothetical protein
MSDLFIPGADVELFLRDAIEDGYSMEEDLVNPLVVTAISQELEREGYLVDLTELVPTYVLEENEMTMASLLHKRINQALCRVEGVKKNHIPLFSVRVFEAGVHGTTIHRNHPAIGPWAIGITLQGEAPFNVYDDDVIEGFSTIPLFGDEFDPQPYDSMETGPGSAWTLYTKKELVPHSSGIVRSSTQRELIIFYNTDNH